MRYFALFYIILPNIKNPPCLAITRFWRVLIFPLNLSVRVLKTACIKGLKAVCILIVYYDKQRIYFNIPLNMPIINYHTLVLLRAIVPLILEIPLTTTIGNNVIKSVQLNIPPSTHCNKEFV